MSLPPEVRFSFAAPLDPTQALSSAIEKAALPSTGSPILPPNSAIRTLDTQNQKDYLDLLVNHCYTPQRNIVFL